MGARREWEAGHRCLRTTFTLSVLDEVAHPRFLAGRSVLMSHSVAGPCTEHCDAKGLLERNIHYALSFYDLYTFHLPQIVAEKGAGIVPQLVEQLIRDLWGHHRTIIDKCRGDRSQTRSGLQ